MAATSSRTLREFNLVYDRHQVWIDDQRTNRKHPDVAPAHGSLGILSRSKPGSDEAALLDVLHQPVDWLSR